MRLVHVARSRGGANVAATRKQLFSRPEASDPPRAAAANFFVNDTFLSLKTFEPCPGTKRYETREHGIKHGRQAFIMTPEGGDIVTVGTKDDLDRRLSADASLSPVGQHIAEFIRQNREFVLTATAAAIGVKAGTSDATVLRTIQTLGFTGIAELKRTILESMGSTSSSADDMRSTLADLQRSTSNAVDLVVQTHREGFCRTAKQGVPKPDRGRRRDARRGVAYRYFRHRAFGFGGQPHRLPAGAIRTRTLDVTGAMLANQLLDLRRGDALLILAYGRIYKEVSAVFGEAKKLRLPTVLVTEATETPLAKQANIVIAIPRGRPGQIALHGATLVGLESIVFALAAANPDQTAPFAGQAQRTSRQRRFDPAGPGLAPSHFVPERVSGPVQGRPTPAHPSRLKRPSRRLRPLFVNFVRLYSMCRRKPDMAINGRRNNHSDPGAVPGASTKPSASILLVLDIAGFRRGRNRIDEGVKGVAFARHGTTDIGPSV